MIVVKTQQIFIPRIAKPQIFFVIKKRREYFFKKKKTFQRESLVVLKFIGLNRVRWLCKNPPDFYSSNAKPQFFFALFFIKIFFLVLFCLLFTYRIYIDEDTLRRLFGNYKKHAHKEFQKNLIFGDEHTFQ